MDATYDLFSKPCESVAHPVVLNLPDADVRYYANLFSLEESQQMFQCLRSDIAWRQDNIMLYGRECAVPRLTAWHGDPGRSYTYSGIRAEPAPWIPVLVDIKARIEAVATVAFNSVLLNRYRNGSDSVAWHADDEPELGLNPVIGSVSFGASRRFQMKHRLIRSQRQSLTLDSGSLLLMTGATQHHWLHQIPKTRRAVGERINLTYRVVR